MMRDLLRRGALLWTIGAVVGAVLLTREAVAGSYVSIVSSNTGIQYFSVKIDGILGKRLKSTTYGATQMLIDDITYGIEIQPDPYTPVVYPLWSPPEFNASYETGPSSGTVFPLSYTVWSVVLAPGSLPSGRTINYDIEVWSNARANPYQEQMQEVDNSGVFVRALDGARQYQGGNLHGRAEHVPGGSRGDAASVQVAESLVTLSGSRHFKTPHIITTPNECKIGGPIASGLVKIEVYVKGRVVVDAGDALVESSSVVVH
jgi:hypothetical protein